MTEHELLTWLEAWFRDNTLLTIDPASPRSEVWLTMIECDIAVDEKLFDLRDLVDDFRDWCASRIASHPEAFLGAVVARGFQLLRADMEREHKK